MRRTGSLATVALVAVTLSGCLSHHRGAMPGEPTGATFAELRGTRVRYVDEGEGPAVVLVHGFASSLNAWDGVRAVLLRRGFRVVALDLKGFGWTDRPEGDYSPEEQARIVLALMDRLGVEQAAMVGHSWGSSVVLAAAVAAPHRVSRIALYDAYVYEDQLPTLFHWAKVDGVGEVLFAAFYDERPADKLATAFYDPRVIDQRLVDEVVDALDRPGTSAAALAAVRGMDYGSTAPRYREVEQPVLLLWGREDAVTPLGYGEQLAVELPNASLRIFPRCGHFPMIEAFHASTRALASFLEEAEGRVPPPGAPRGVSGVPAEPPVQTGEPTDTPTFPMDDQGEPAEEVLP